MRYGVHAFLLENLVTEEMLPKDDIDLLFEKLQPLEPPASLIARILQVAAHSSAMPSLFSPALHDPWEEFDSLAGRNDRLTSC